MCPDGLVYNLEVEGAHTYLANGLVAHNCHEAAEIAMDFQGFQLTPAKIHWMVRGLAGRTDHAHELIRRCTLAVDAFFKALKQGDEGTELIEAPLVNDHGLCEVLRTAAGIYQGLANTTKTETSAGLIQQVKTAAKAKACYALADHVGEVCFGYVEDEDGVKRLGSIANQGEFKEGRVYYTERTTRDGALTTEIHCKVVNVKYFFRKHVFQRKTAIMTSATLATNKSFGFILDQFGLRSEEVKTLIVPTPFDANKVIGVVPKGFTSPDDKDKHAKDIAHAINRMMKKVRGGVMVLFTSHKSLQIVATLLRKWQIEEQAELFVQGERPKSRIIELFKEAHKQKKKALILGTSSFWQGVDIPGQALSVVAIDKIPFPRPTDPVMRYLQDSGRNAFWEYGLPKAVIDMKQGIGRLIRSEADYGAVIVFDVRINTMNYGDLFKSALPEGCYFSQNLKDVPAFLERHGKRRKRLA